MPKAIDRTLKKTPLDLLHREFKARMVSFADHTLPVQYAHGIIAEHTHTREKASLFDISHMGQVTISGINAEKKIGAPGTGRYHRPGRGANSIYNAD